MDPVLNPYTPGAGTPPRALVGRDRELEQFRVMLGRLERELPERSSRALLKREAWRLFDAFVETGRRGALEVEYGVRPARQELVLSSWSALIDGVARHLELRAPDPHDFPDIVRGKVGPPLVNSRGRAR